eukprot:TRINITY_DN30169_c0_g1_i1.p1 TRINITY_DN30169_c0_g1~~TRINITY_DN30169_c0_g1_i1.p1  ORF type:complete len:457 (+),score=75.57 TRINITY_DN30169_c0_g1_i1:159-1529(+)
MVVVEVSTLSGESYRIDEVDLAETLSSVRERAAAVYGMRASMLTMIFNGAELTESDMCRTLQDFGIQEDVSFTCIQKPSVDGEALGIKVGTSNACAGLYCETTGSISVVINANSNKTTPVHVHFADARTIVGEMAKFIALRKPESTPYATMRLIGRKLGDPEVLAASREMPYGFDSDADGKLALEVSHSGELHRLSPEDVTCFIVSQMREFAEKALQKAVRNAVVCVPIHFGQVQRQAMLDVCANAALHVLCMLDEPAAAAIAYGLEKATRKKNALVFRIGGGTCDVSVYSIGNGCVDCRAFVFDLHFGGDNFDERIAQHVIELRQESRGKYGSSVHMARLLNQCNHAKRSLMRGENSSLIDDRFLAKLDRCTFDRINEANFARCKTMMANVLDKADLNADQIEAVVLAGGSANLIKLRSMIRETFASAEIHASINPEEVIAYGATLEAAILTGKV